MLRSSALPVHTYTMPRDAVVGALDPPDRMDLAIKAVQQGRSANCTGDEESYPFEVLQKVRAYPSADLTYHAFSDTAVSVEEIKLDRGFQESSAGVDVLMKIGRGDHGDLGSLEEPSLLGGWLNAEVNTMEGV